MEKRDKKSYFHIFPANLQSHLKVFILLNLIHLACGSACADESSTVVYKFKTPPYGEAVDLIYKGKAIDQDRATQLKKEGVDISELEPSPNDMFGNPSTIESENMPNEGDTLDYDSPLKGSGHEISTHRVRTLNGLNLRLYVSDVPHRALMTRALLTRLGYIQDKPRRYRTLKVRFKSIKERDDFIGAVTVDTAFKAEEKWVIEMPSNSPTITFQDIILEHAGDVADFYWAILSQNFSEGRRAFRALLAPIALCNLTENIDSYKWTMGRIADDAVVIPFPLENYQKDGGQASGPFFGVSDSDIRWIAKRIAKLTTADWKAIVNESELPGDLADLVLQKVIARRNNLMSLFDLKVGDLPYNVRLSNSSVKNGQVIRAKFPGYASKFTYGDTEDPLNTKEMLNFSAMLGITSAMESISSKINSYLNVYSASNYATIEQAKMLADYQNYVAKHPKATYVRPIKSFGGPVGGFSVNASRQIATGTFYGSKSPLQLVDTFSISAAPGYFRALDGLSNVAPSMQGSMYFTRSYTHLRTMAKIGDSLKAKGSDIGIQNLIELLTKVLQNPNRIPDTNEGKTKKILDYTAAIEDFLDKIQDGEMYTITDSVASGLSANIRIPVQAFYPSAPVGYNQGISFGAGVGGAVLRRTVIQRVNDRLTNNNYVQITAQTVDLLTGSVALDFNYYVNILHIGREKSLGLAKSRVYIVDSSKKRAQSISNKLALALIPLLQTNSDRALRANYPFFQLNHKSKDDSWNMNFLVFQTKEMEDNHLLKIRPPIDPDHVFEPKDFERTLFSSRKISRSGFNYLSLVSGIIGAASKGAAQVPSGSGDNPAYSPFGSSHWTSTFSDGEITKGISTDIATVSTETWAGWTISRAKLNQVFDEIDRKSRNLASLITVSPIHRDVFGATEKVELYNISATTYFMPVGVKKILSLLYPEDGGNYRPIGLEKLDSDSYSKSDQKVYANIVKLLGGKGAYQEQWRMENPNNTDMPVNTIWKGNSYQFLDSWMREVLTLRRSRPVGGSELIQWQTKAIDLLQRKIPTDQLMREAGRDGFIYLVSVTGFRKGDHQARNSERAEEFDSYVSDTVGAPESLNGIGAFATLSNDTRIPLYELGALYFSGGE